MLRGGGREQVWVQCAQVSIQHTMKHYVSGVLRMVTMPCCLALYTQALGGHESAEVVRHKAYCLLGPLRKCLMVRTWVRLVSVIRG